MNAIPVSQPGPTFLSYAATRTPITTSRQGDSLTVRQADTALLTLHLAEGCLMLAGPAGSAETAWRGLTAAIEATFGWYPELERLALNLGNGMSELAEALRRRGLALETAAAPLTVLPELFMQQADLWHGRPDLPAFPQRQVMTNGKRHPQRPPKPQGTVYARWIPWLEQTLAFRAATVEDDLGHLHKWMNDPRVAAFWNEDGDLEKHHRYLSELIADPHMVPLIATFDGVPFAYFEIYWARENRLAPFYDVQDYDRGWHVVVGEDAYRGRRFISAWLPSLAHYMLLDDCRTQRIVGEPAAAHHQQIRNLETSGYARIKTFDFPHKRAALVMLLRERFFFDRLWQPATATQPVPQA